MPTITGGNNISSSDQITDGIISNADVASDAAIAKSKLDLAGTISATDVAASTLVTEAEGIENNDNDTTLPTSAAVLQYLADNFGPNTQTVPCSIPVTVNDPVYISGGNIAAPNAGAAGTARFFGFAKDSLMSLLDSEEITSANHSYELPAGNNRIMIVATVQDSTSSATAAWDGNNLTVINEHEASGEYLWVGYILLGSSATPTTANIVLTGAYDRALVAVYDGIHQSSPLGDNDEATVNLSSTISTTTTVAGSKVVGLLGNNNSPGTVTSAISGTNATQRLNVGNWLVLADAPSFAAEARTFTAGGSNYANCAMIAFELKPAASQTIDVQTERVVSGFTGLTLGEEYYLTDAMFGYGTTAGTNTVLIGKAVSTTEMLIVH